MQALYDSPVRHWHAHSHFDSAPFGDLVKRNSFIELLRSSETVRLLHITTNLAEVKRQKRLFASTGCLVGSIYCAPLFPGPRGLRAHNLGGYIYEHEAQRALRSKKLDSRTVSPLIIEVKLPAHTPQGIVGVNYLRLGAVHMQMFNKLAARLPKHSRTQLEQLICQQIHHVMPFLKICHQISAQGKSYDPGRFFETLSQTVPHFPMLGYIYFEAITEYIMLFSSDKQSQRLAAQGEINCWGHKEFIFRAQPSLLHSFNLGNFRPNLADIQNVLRQLASEKITNVDASALATYTMHRVSSLVCDCLLNDTDHLFCSHTAHYEFDQFTVAAPQLVGNAIDRNIRVTKDLASFCYEFDTYRARQIWHHWERTNLILPFNGLLPKGEVGINPAHSQLEYKIYDARPVYISDELYIEPTNALDIKIVPELINPSLAFMGITTGSQRAKHKRGSS